MITWITENWQGIVGILAAAHVLALAIVNITPTPKDNEIYAKFYGWIEKFAGMLTPKAKE